MARPYTDALVDYLTTSAGGTSAGDPSRLSRPSKRLQVSMPVRSPVLRLITRR